MPSVYVHIVLANGKRYYGQHLNNNPEERWGSKGHRYKGQLFGDIIEKYGWDNMIHEVLHKDLTQEEADYYEQYYIALYKTNVARWKDEAEGYNLTDGGKDGAPSFGERNAMSRPVIRIETNEEWESASMCAKDININPSSLQESLYHGYICGGYHYKYKDDNDYKINERRHSYGVICKETGKIWNTVKECADELHVKPATINKYCRGVINSSSGLHYEHYVI